MPMTNPPSCQGNLQHHAGPPHATSSHPRFLGHRDEEEEEEGRTAGMAIIVVEKV